MSRCLDAHPEALTEMQAGYEEHMRHIGPGVALPDGMLVRVGTEWVAMPATLTPLGEALRNLCATKLAVIAEKRRTRAAQQEHLSRWNEAHEIAAEYHNSDPHDDLTWREMLADDLPF